MSNNLMEKLAISKAIMDKHNSMGRGQSTNQSVNLPSNPELDEYEAPQAKYNIPQELMAESKTIDSNPQFATKDRILNSKLPDEIKKLMIENPIVPVNPMAPSNSVLTDELVEKAARLMGNKKTQPQSQPSQQTTPNNDNLRKMMKEVVKEVLQENGLILESASKTNETVVIKVGQHIFEGKISKIKKTR